MGTSSDDVISPGVGLELGGGVGGLFITFNFFFLQALFSGQVLDLGRNCLLPQLREKWSSSPSSSSSPSPAELCLSDKSEILPALGWMGSLGILRGEQGGENQEVIPLSLIMFDKHGCPAVNVFALLLWGEWWFWPVGLGETDLIRKGGIFPMDSVLSESCSPFKSRLLLSIGLRESLLVNILHLVAILSEWVPQGCSVVRLILELFEINVLENYSCRKLCTSLPSGNKAALKPREDVKRSPKQGYQWPHKKGFSKKNFQKCSEGGGATCNSG